MPSIGIDCEDIETFRRHELAASERFYRRIFTAAEIEWCSGRADPYPHFAARFAAKEAVIKALSPERVFHHDVEILRREDGSPHVRMLRDGAATGKTIRVSLSHSRSQAMACALVE